MAARRWTEEQKQKQRIAIQQWKPWTHSTGPRTVDGKRKVSRNAENASTKAFAAHKDLIKKIKALFEQQQTMLKELHRR